MQSSKKVRRNTARSKAKRRQITAGIRAKRRKKRNIIIGVAIFIAIIIAVIVGAVFSALTEVYTDGNATIELRPNGRFSALLYHNERYTGTYTTSQTGGATFVHFTYGDITSVTMFIEDGLVIPDDWDDGHGHGSVLPKR